VINLRTKKGGFSLVEMAIVLAIIGLLAVAVLGGGSLLDSTKTTNLGVVAKDLSSASARFRERYKYWPGDLPLARNEIPNVPDECHFAIQTANIGNGLIDTAGEVGCAIEDLFQAGLVRASVVPPATLHTIAVDGISVRLVAAGASNVANFLPGTNVVEFGNIRCEQVINLDRKIDDDNIDRASTGKAKASVAACAAGSIVPFYAVAIN